MTRFVILLLACCFVGPAFGQKPIPGPAPGPVIVQDDAMFFAGATEIDRAVVTQARKAIIQSDLSFRDKGRFRRLLMQPRFVEDLKQEAIDFGVWGDGSTPEQMEQIVQGKWLDFFNNLDLQKWVDFIKILIDLFSATDRLSFQQALDRLQQFQAEARHA